ncbi:homoserine kinase [Halothiobacillus sp. DCM-1]|uniref:homoserine kinase n=1 Tax=Halothiobacillus sp. DCM-1 TaxID=3112558 RepID=UPI00324A380E
MSVFTPVHEPELRAFLTQYDAGTLHSHAGIAAGIENTNYFVTTDRQALVLTLFEHHRAEELHYFLDLMAFFAEHDIPTAHPLCAANGSYLNTLNGKPAALVQRLRGQSIDQPSPAQCQALGRILGRAHRVSPAFSGYRPPDRALPWACDVAATLSGHLPAEEADLMAAELAAQTAAPRTHLPQGAIHADLFCDNALFDGDQLTGIIDWYYACNDALGYDLAVTVNDWCRTDDHRIDPVRAQALLAGYQQERPLTADERDAWPLLLRSAALRFWLSRQKDWLFPRAGEMTFRKDPRVFLELLQHHRAGEAECRRWLA